MKIRMIKEDELKRYAEIVFNAYPGFGVPDAEKAAEYIKKVLDSDHSPAPWGVFEDGEMAGGMLIDDFDMNFRSKNVAAKGVGLVAVDLTRKREKICREMIKSFIAQTADSACDFALLYPFRPDFYRKMGFGYSSSLKKYRIRTAAFPRKGDKSGIRLASDGDTGAITELYNAEAASTHGMIKRTIGDFERLMTGKMRTAVHVSGKTIDGYMCFGFRKGHESNFTLNDLIVRELMVKASDPAVTAAFHAFINSQSDQCVWTDITTFDDEFYHLFDDPRDRDGALVSGVNHDSYRGGVGLMCRVTSPGGPAALFRDAELGGGDVDVLFKVSDTLSGGPGEYAVSFRDGRAEVCESGKTDITLEADIAVFSSIAMGSLGVRNAVAMGLARIDMPCRIPLLDRVLAPVQKPRCVTEF